MVRLTEIGRGEGQVIVEVEGSLTGGALDLLGEELRRYREAGCLRVTLRVDGVQSVSHRIASDPDWGEGLQVRFHTSRPALGHQLATYGLSVELVP